MHGLRLAAIPHERYAEYRHDVIFNAYKWDPQTHDSNTISRYAVLMSPQTARTLEHWVERLAEETVRLEEQVLNNLPLAKQLGLPNAVYRSLPRLRGYKRSNHVRLMRFDFHPTTEGWAISEVNSDVPGGLAEASVLPRVAARYIPDGSPHGHVAQALRDAFEQRIGQRGRIAFVHATSYSDDRQVMQFLGDYFEQNGHQAIPAAPDHIVWRDRQAHCILQGMEGKLDGVARFYPLEWLENLPRKTNWHGFYDSQTVSCNHPMAIFAQSKRLPLLWEGLPVDTQAWRQLLPETRDPRAPQVKGEGWIYKPALGRVGEGISIAEAISPKELAKIHKAVKAHPTRWIAQRRFSAVPLLTGEGEPYYLCLGVFTVDGRCAGFYGRVSTGPLIDARAMDIPILVQAREDAICAE